MEHALDVCTFWYWQCFIQLARNQSDHIVRGKMEIPACVKVLIFRYLKEICSAKNFTRIIVIKCIGVGTI